MDEPTVLISKDTPGSAPGGYEWTEAGEAIEVPRGLAGDLLHIPDGDFREVEGEEPVPPPVINDGEITPPPGDDLAGPPPVTEPDPADTVDIPEELPKLKADLQALAGELGLDDSGTVQELKDRIEEFRAIRRTPVTEPDPDAHNQ